MKKFSRRDIFKSSAKVAGGLIIIGPAWRAFAQVQPGQPTTSATPGSSNTSSQPATTSPTAAPNTQTGSPTTGFFQPSYYPGPAPSTNPAASQFFQQGYFSSGYYQQGIPTPNFFQPSYY